MLYPHCFSTDALEKSDNRVENTLIIKQINDDSDMIKLF